MLQFIGSFALGPVPEGRALLTAQLPASPHLQIGILKGYLETEGPEKGGEKTSTYSTPLCAVLYSKIFKQVSGLELAVPRLAGVPGDTG